VMNFLKECDEPKALTQIANALNCNPIRVSHILKNLLSWKEIKFKEYGRTKASKMVGYVLLRRARFYFIEKD